MKKETVKKLGLCEVILHYLNGDGDMCDNLQIAADEIVEDDSKIVGHENAEYKEWRDALCGSRRSKKPGLMHRIRKVKEQMIYFIDHLEEIEEKFKAEGVMDIVEIKQAESKDEWELCLNGQWYRQINYHHGTSVETLIDCMKQDELRDIQEVVKENSDDLGYDYIVTVVEDSAIDIRETYAVKVKQEGI